MRRRPWGRNEAEKISWRQDRNPAKRIQHKQIGISSNKHIGIATNSQFEKLVVGRIATIADLFCYAYQLGFLQKGYQEAHTLLFG